MPRCQLLLLSIAAVCLATSACSTAPNAKSSIERIDANKPDHFGELVGLYQHNQWARCIRKAPYFIKTRTHIREARWILARSYLACNQPENALPLVNDALAGEAGNIDLLNLKVDVWQRMGRHKEALELCQKALLKADRFDLHLAAGQLALREKQFDQAESELQLALRAVPVQSPIAKAVMIDALAQICAARGNHPGALKNLKAALNLDPRGAGGMVQAHLAKEYAAVGDQKLADFVNWKFGDIICRTPANRQQGAQALAGSFLLERGKLKRYLDLGQRQLKGKYDTYVEAAFDLSAADLEPFFHDYVKNLAPRLPELTAYPVSTILPNQAAFRLFVKKYKISLTGLTPYHDAPQGKRLGSAVITVL